MLPRVYRSMLLLCLAMATVPAGAASPLKIVADYWPPFSDGTQPDNGLAIDLVSTALSRAGYSSDYTEVPWARALKGLEVGDYDVLATAWYSEARTHYGIYSAPYMVNRVRLLKKAGNNVTFTGLADLHRYSIAVARGYAYSPGFDEDATLNKVVVRNFISGARMVIAGRVDLSVEDEYVAQYYLAQEPNDLARSLAFIDPPLSISDLHILVSKKSPDRDRIIAAFNSSIVAMKADGTYAALFRKHGIGPDWQVP